MARGGAITPYLEPLPVSAKARVLWPVWPKYATLRGLETLPLPLQFAFSHSVMTPDRRLMLVKNSKAGCTTAAQTLFELATGGISGNVHQERSALLQGKLAWRAFAAALDAPDTVVFSVIRHPVSRAVSAFKDFVLDARNPGARHHVAPLADRGIAQAPDDSTKFDIFLDYVEETLALSPERCDRHWRPQVLNLALDQIRYTRLCRLENYAEDMADVLARAGCAPAPGGAAGGTRFNATRSQFRPSAAQEARVRAIYEEDMHRLGYS